MIDLHVKQQGYKPCFLLCASFNRAGAGKIFPSFLTFLTFLTFFSLSRTLVTLPRAPFRPPRRFIILGYVHPPPPPMWSEEGLDKVPDVERDLFVMNFTKSKSEESEKSEK